MSSSDFVFKIVFCECPFNMGSQKVCCSKSQLFVSFPIITSQFLAVSELGLANEAKYREIAMCEYSNDQRMQA